MKKGGILLILLAFLCVGQGFGPKIVKGPMLSGSGTGVPQLPTAYLAYYWHFLDLSTNNAKVTAWTDRIQGAVWTNGADNANVINTPLGVSFAAASTTVLTNAGLTIPLADGITIIFILQKNSSAAYQTFLSAGMGSGFNEFLFYNNDTLHLHYQGFADRATAAVKEDARIDLIWVQNGTLQWYTNGISGQASGNAAMGTDTLKTLGSGLDGYFSGYITELAIYTNLPFDATSISNAHYYATNTYNYSP